MKKWTLILPLVVALTAVTTWFASLYYFERPVFDKRVQQRMLPSTVLGEQRDYLVHLPESYAEMPHRRYPMIYVLDGSSQDVHTAASAALMARIGVMPEVIVVGIPNIDGEGRQRDYTPPGMRQDLDVADSPYGRADAFLAFLRDELIPRVERDYRTQPLRMIAGNSRGGLFVIYSLIAAPELFDVRFAHSPALWRDDEALLKQLDTFLVAHPRLRGQLFLSLGSNENDKMKAAFAHARALLARQAPPALAWKAQLTRNGDHRNNAELAMPVALRHVYERWTPVSSEPTSEH